MIDTSMTLLPNQSILDAVLTRYGSLEAAVLFCIQNNIPISLLPAAGTHYTQPALSLGYDAVESTDYLRNKDIIIATANSGVCGVVTGITISEVEIRSALASFAAGENAQSIEWCIADGVHTLPTSDTNVEPPGITSVELDLDPATEYTFLVRTNCHGTDSSWRSVVFTTPPELFITMVFRPLMMHVDFSTSLPAPYYAMQWGLDAGAYSEFGFAILPVIPELQFTTKSAWDSGMPPFPSLTPAIYDPGGTGMLFHVPAPIVPGTVYLWFSNLGPNASCRYIDLVGNVAPCMPAVVYESGMGLKKMLAQMECGAGSTLGGLFHLPIIISHTGDNIYFPVVEHRIKELIGGLWIDRTGPLSTGDAVLLAFTAGIHTIGVFTTYQSAGTLSPPPGPISINALVFRIAETE